DGVHCRVLRLRRLHRRQIAQRQPMRPENAGISPSVVRGPISGRELFVERIQLQAKPDDAVDQQLLRDGRLATDMRDEFGLEMPDKPPLRTTTVDEIADGAALKLPWLRPKTSPS